MPNSFGLIVEGTYDEAALSELISRLVAPAPFIRSFTCGGIAGVIKNFPAYLKALQYEVAGGPVNKAIVVVDSNGDPPQAVVAKMQSKIVGRQYNFPDGMHFGVIVRELEAWLLADENALNGLSSNKPGRTVPRLAQLPETLADPKAELERRLAYRGIGYSPETARGIVAATTWLHLRLVALPSPILDSA